MNNPKNKNRMLSMIRWTARIWSIVSVAFLLFMVVGHLFGSEQSNPPTFGEWIGLFFFPFGICVGLIIAWKWEGAGGMITIGSIIGFHVTMLILHGDPEFVPLIDGLAAPGILFLIYWFLSRGQLETKETE